MKVLYHESNKLEDWETTLRKEKDSETYQLEDGINENISNESYEHLTNLKAVYNEGENHISLANYKNSVQKLLGLENNLPVIPENA